jgi:hypothetical protein
VTIDGQFVRRPVSLSANSWWVFEGFNAKNGDAAAVVYYVNGSNDNIMRRVVAWDAAINANNNVIGVHRSVRNLFEDVAAFGTARKVFSNSYGGDDITCRRCWIRWEGSTFGSSIGATMAYNSTGATFENVLVTWSGESMPQTYTIPTGGLAAGTAMSNFQLYAPVGILSVDRIDGATPKHANVHLQGSIVYTKATDRIPATGGGGTPGGAFTRLFVFGSSSISVQHVVSVMDPAHPRFHDHLGIALTRTPQNCAVKAAKCEDPVVDNTATHITSISGGGDIFHSDWAVTKESVGTSRAEVVSPWTATGTGANLCRRWGSTAPLWPWPMNERIKAATESAGSYTGPCPTCVGGRAVRAATDVTADIEKLLGPIPASCRH